MFKRLPLLLSYTGYLLLAPLLPLIIWQGKNTRKTALRLPEAEGPRSGAAGSAATAPLNILHLGESTVAGVGVDQSGQGFTANISKALETSDTDHHWQYIAQTGIDTSGLIQLVNKQDTIADCSHLIITMGVNDTTGFSHRKLWRDNLKTLANRIQQQNPVAEVLFTQVPPMHRFPALAKPLNLFLGLRAWQLNQELQLLCQQHHWRFIAIDLPLQPEWMAEDGYHPNAAGYRLWGEGVANAILQKLATLRDD